MLLNFMCFFLQTEHHIENLPITSADFRCGSYIFVPLHAMNLNTWSPVVMGVKHSASYALHVVLSYFSLVCVKSGVNIF